MSAGRWYDVFLNFRGKDTRNGFTAHLYDALCHQKIQTFMDADKILKGQEISPALVTAMDKSMFCVVVLSKNYAFSTWCLDELVQILNCKNDKKQTVLPIFYGVDPSDVREQKGSFAKAFAKHEDKFKEEKREMVQKWKQALTDVANISGWDARNRHEPTLIKEITDHISSRLIKRSWVDSQQISLLDNIPTLPSKRKMNEIKEKEIEISKSREVELDILIPSSIDDLPDFDIIPFSPVSSSLLSSPLNSSPCWDDEASFLEFIKFMFYPSGDEDYENPPTIAALSVAYCIFFLF